MTDMQFIANNLFEPDDIIELRLIRGKAPHVLIEKFWVYAKDLPSWETGLRNLNEQGFNIYFGPNPRKEFEKSGDSNVLLARCLFCDFDTLEDEAITAIGKNLSHFPEPSLLVHSGHGFHCYWRLTEPVLDMNLWKAIQVKLNARLEADKTIKNPERIMRLPGFLNTKRESFVPCYILGDQSCKPVI
jgi:hypothetical protein